MERRIDIEVIVGLFVIVGIASLAYLSIKLGRLEVIGGERYVVYAEFSQVGGLKPGASIEIAGVTVGSVKDVVLDKNYMAMVALAIDKSIKVQEDAIASVKTQGLIGEKFIQISPGGSEKLVPPGGRIRETESAVDLEGLISQFVFGKV
jgi:phospholipid/cholesterol/gamma-HCH transport system substrate-binding protein